MKLFIIFFVFFPLQLFSQTYLNILFSNNNYKYSQISSLQKITLSPAGEQLNFHLSDGTTSTENTADVKRMSLDAFSMGEILPVELSTFTISSTGSSVLLRWRTETEINNYGFEVERASVSAQQVQKWVKIGFILGNGNSNTARNYSFNDTPLKNDIFRYRLKQINRDGTFEYSRTVEVTIGNRPNVFELLQNYPNPFNPATHISYTLPTDGFVTIKIFDIIGREVSLLVNENKKAGTHAATFDGSTYGSGLYICRINFGFYNSSIKMTLMK
jgi:hypothetical protein